MKNLRSSILLCILIGLHVSAQGEVKKPSDLEEYCQSEYFQPRCLHNQVIVMKTAIYGRMRIGKCVRAEEVEAQKKLADYDSRFLGCSADVLPLLNRKCSGKSVCDVRVFAISDENIHPCFPGLNVHLEASYDCVSLVDEKRSCAVTASKNAVHVMGASDSVNTCGTKSHPWIIESPVGQKISISLLDFTASDSDDDKMSCRNYGVIVDRAAKRNTSICGRTDERETSIYLSTGNSLMIFLDSSSLTDSKDAVKSFLLKIEAIGCSDVIPPEDAWLKRKDDSITIGCYSSRQTWHLSCSGGKWIGVLGNCSHDAAVQNSAVVPEPEAKISSEEQVLAMVAIVGCTLAICLAIVCIGAVCLRRFHVQAKKKQAYKTLNYSTNTGRSQHTNNRIPSGAANDFVGLSTQHVPTYSVFAGQDEFNEAVDKYQKSSGSTEPCVGL